MVIKAVRNKNRILLLPNMKERLETNRMSHCPPQFDKTDDIT